jgi:4-diphosphocytidyl-2-C-methyl-D-erythritol kinase
MLEVASLKDGLAVEAPAKVNLTLRVLGRRADGYHDLESVVAAVGLCDTLRFRLSDDLALSSGGLAVPTGDDNLIVKAARLLRETSGVKAGARIDLQKRIPLGRGLGGGSSDAAAALAGLNALWRCGLGRADLARLGARIGSDVPLFLGTPVAVMRGRGERIEPAPGAPRWRVLLAWPDYGLPTPEVYAAYDRLALAAGARTEVTAILRYLDRPAREVGPLLFNDLELAARSVRYNGVDVRKALEAAGAGAFSMTGSGSAYFALADTEAEARGWATAVRAAGGETVLTTMLAGMDPQRESRP